MAGALLHSAEHTSVVHSSSGVRCSMTVFSNTTLQCEKGYACTRLNPTLSQCGSFGFKFPPLFSHSFDHYGLVCIHGDDKVESVVITKLLVIPQALYPGSFPLTVQAWVRGYYPTKSNSISIIFCNSIYGKKIVYPAAGIQT